MFPQQADATAWLAPLRARAEDTAGWEAATWFWLYRTTARINISLPDSTWKVPLTLPSPHNRPASFPDSRLGTASLIARDMLLRFSPAISPMGSARRNS